MRSACSLRTRSVRRILARGSSSSLWPTACANDWKGSSEIGQRRGQLSEAAEKLWLTPLSQDSKHGGLSPANEDRTLLCVQAVLWQTPLAGSGNTRGQGAGGAPFLPGQAAEVAGSLWPTPDASVVTDSEDPEHWLERMNARRETEKVRYGTPLAVAARLWPTMVVQCRLVRRPSYSPHSQATSTPGDSSSNSARSSHRLWPTVLACDASMTPRDPSDFSMERRGRGGINSLSNEAVKTAGGDKQALRLNPRFVEWLMGWPLGWTDFGPVATGWSLYRRLMRSLCCRMRTAYVGAVSQRTRNNLGSVREF